MASEVSEMFNFNNIDNKISTALSNDYFKSWAWFIFNTLCSYNRTQTFTKAKNYKMGKSLVSKTITLFFNSLCEQ